VIYEDALGRSRALRYRQSQEYLFPITMISRRQEADNHTPVAAIYQKAYGIIDPLRPELPFRSPARQRTEVRRVGHPVLVFSQRYL
jgi:hypothetical protein